MYECNGIVHSLLDSLSYLALPLELWFSTLTAQLDHSRKLLLNLKLWHLYFLEAPQMILDSQRRLRTTELLAFLNSPHSLLLTGRTWEKGLRIWTPVLSSEPSGLSSWASREGTFQSAPVRDAGSCAADSLVCFSEGLPHSGKRKQATDQHPPTLQGKTGISLVLL